MGKAAKRMRKVLNDTGIYHLTGRSPADWELNACGAGFDLVEGAVDDLLADLFPTTASAERLDSWEALHRLQPSVGTLQERQAITAARLAMNPQRFSAEEFSSMIRAAGVEGVVQDDEDGVRILLGRIVGLSEEQAEAELEKVMPAHLPWEWDESVTWTALDSWAPPFAVIDSLEMTWDELEALGREDLEALPREMPPSEEPEAEEPEIADPEIAVPAISESEENE